MSLHFVVHPLPGSNDSLNDRIREVAEKINKYGGHTQPALAGLKVPIKQTVLGPSHIGILLEDGRAYRCAYSIIPERLDLTKNEPMKSSMAGGSNLTANTSSGSKSSQSSSRQLSRSRARILRTSSSVRGGSGSRSTGVIIGGSSGRSMVTVPAPLVPEELVSQAQVVLQGKSRNVIIRELQRTNLDVNLAVNNLLSRDDEEGDETEETNENYVPEDLISLLDNGFHTDNSIIIDAEAPFSEDIFGYSNIRNLLYSRVRSERNNPNGSGAAAAGASSSGTATGTAAAPGGSSADGGAGAGAGAAPQGAGGSSRSSSLAASGVLASGAAAGGQAGVASSGGVQGSSASGSSSANNNNLLSLSNSAPPIPPISDRDSFSRWRDRQYFGPRRWFQSPREDATWEKESEVIKKDLSSGVPLWISEDLEAWPERDQPIRFVQIASLHSEFIGVTAKGELHQWKWSEHEPYRSAENLNLFHPKTATLNLAYEKVTHISATSIRCSVATESNRIATWMDELLGHAGVKLEHAAITLPDLSLDRIASLHTCSLYSVARTENGGIYWWGVLPYSQRKKLWDKFRAKTRKPDRTNMRNIFYSEVTVGAQVCMKNAPMYMPGAIGFTISNGVPKVGQLLNAAWDFNDTCRFKIISVAPPPAPPVPPSASGGGGASASGGIAEPKESSSKSSGGGSSSGSGKSGTNKETADRMDMPPPPSPASSTCSDTASGSSHKRAKRVTPREDGDGKKDEELWPMKDVVFVEDVKTVALGRVVKIDGAFAAVELTSTGENKEEREDVWTNCRLLKREDLQVMKSTASSRGPDCFQKTPRRINLSLLQPGLPFQLLALTVDAKGIHAIVKHSSKVHYALFNLNSGRQEQDSVFPSDVNAFMGNNPKQISLTSAADAAESVLVLRDGNNAIYPMAKDCLTAIKDPQLLDFAQVRSIAAITLSLPVLESNLKTQLAVIVMAPERQLLMPRILRCDLKGVKAVVAQLDAAGGADVKSQIQGLLSERCDGNRNIFHTCISMCAPSSNKDLDSDAPPTTSSFGTGGASSSSAGGGMQLDAMNSSAGNFTQNRPLTIRDLVRRATLQAVRDNSNDGASNSGGSGGSGGGGGARTGGEGAGGANSQSVGVALDEHGNYMSVGYWDTEYNPYSGDEDSMMGMSSGNNKSNPGKHLQTTSSSGAATYVSDATERRENSLAALALMCSSTALHPYLVQLLSGKDGHGQTPFMLAVSMRAYQGAKVLFDVIMELAQGNPEVRDSMVFPEGSNADQSPLYVLCCNDTCSFTWTGAVHINQDIFECRTCGLVGTLCCCTECAKVCHKGHDCKLKRTSPTAYCDCCEKCKCKALITGNQKKRFELFMKLASDTDLVTRYNSRGESILLFLIQTVSRQLAEQSQYTASSRSRNAAGPSSRKTPNIDGEGDASEHNLEPPRFAKKAIGRLLSDWAAIKSMIMTGVAASDKKVTACTAEDSATQGATAEEAPGDGASSQTYLDGQSGTTLLDKFTHSLITCCSHEPLDALMMTFVREFQNEKLPGRQEEAQSVARRFIRSVARVFVIFSIEKVPVQDKQKTTAPQTRNLQTCRRIFQTLIKVAIEELCETADSLIAPVRLGVVRPTAPFALTSNNVDNSEDVFSVEPLAPVQSRRRSSTTSTGADGIEDGFVGGDLGSRLRGSADMDDPSDADATGQDDGEISEQEEPMEREPVTRSSSRPSRNGNAMLVDESVDNMRNEDVAQEESDFFNFNEAETESDSDDNQSTQDAQRSVQTGATAGSDAGIVHDDDDNDMDQEEDSNDSSQPDEEGSEDGETDEHSQEDFAYTLGEEQLERRTTSSGSHRHNLAPQAMQWAIRNRDSNRPSSVRLTHGGSNFVFIDSGSFRRSATSTGAQEYHPSGAPVISLARAFASVLRQITELLNIAQVNLMSPAPGQSQTLFISYQEIVQLQTRIEEKLKPVWQWVLSVMDATEAQLKFGASLTHSTDPSNPLHPLYHGAGPAPGPSSGVVSGGGGGGASGAGAAGGVSADTQPSRREFLTYCLSLMRSHSSEHRDSLPVLDVTSLRHIAYVLDAIIFYMRAASEQENSGQDKGGDAGLSAPWTDADDHDNEESEDDLGGLGMETDSMDEEMYGGTSMGRRHSFFQRSESTLCLGCPAPDAFSTPLAEALPLADTPHMLQPTSKREELFTMPKPNLNLKGMENSQLAEPPRRLGLSNSFRPIDPHIGGSGSSKRTEVVDQASGSGVKEEEKQAQTSEPQDLSVCKGQQPEEEDEDSDDEDTDVEMEEEEKAATVPGVPSGEVNYEAAPLDAQSVRPQIIVTPRKMASAIESATAAVLAKNRKTSLEECTTSNEVPLEFIPVCVFGRKSDGTPQKGGKEGAERAASASKTVIVRAGCSSQPQDSSSAQSLDLIQGSMEETQEISANVTVETSQVANNQEYPPRGLHLCSFLCDDLILSDLLLGRWRQALDLFSRVFMEDVGLEPGSVICELGGFSVKEARFRRNMEKLRNGQQRDLVLTKMERTRTGLLFQTFKELNTQFGSQTRRSHPPLSFNRVKVTFNNEPGEGSGVARSFYTSIAEAILANEKLPNLEGAQVGKYSAPFSNFALRQRGASSSSGVRDVLGGGSSSSSGRDGSSAPSRILFPTKSRGRQIRDSRKNVTYEASSRSYTLSSLVAGGAAGGSSASGASGSSMGNSGPSSGVGGGSSGGSGASGGACAIVSNIQLSGGAERLYSKVYSLHPNQLGKDGLPVQQTGATMNGDGGESSGSSFAAQGKGGKMNPIVLLDESQLDDSAPLFYSPGKRGFYSPRQGYASFERINAFRNIGRLIGLCLLQNELLPLFLQRHVLKFILGRQIRFHDLAFFDPVVYESLRQLIKESQTKSGAAELQNLEIYFIVDLCPEEGGGSVELIPGGRDILVNETNIYDYVRKYSEYRMLRSQEKALEAIRQGVFDVLPEYALDRLTAEDLRLLLNGVGDIHVGTLISYTTFNDESNEKSDKLIKLKRWLWGTVEKMTSTEKQDLLNFWTGSPALPASEEGFQPMPTVNIRPADDAHLPTANTCISRLYIPLYSSKAILRHKLLLAIKAKNFGFV